MSEISFDQQLPIILVDDDPMAIYLTKEILLDYNSKIKFISYTDTEKFFESAMSFDDSSIVLLDLNMPRKNGWDIIEELKNRGLHFRIIVLTASLNEEDHFKARRLGIGFLEKPLQVTEFEHELKNLN